MKKALIILGVSAVTAVVTKVVTSNVKKQKEEKGKIEFKGLFEKAAAKQAAKDSVKAVKGIGKEALIMMGLKVIVEIFKADRKYFNKVAIIMGVVCGGFGILSTAMDRKKYKEVFDGKKRLIIPAMLIDTILHIAHYVGCFALGGGIRLLIDCYRYKCFESWISKIILETIVGSIVADLLLMFVPSISKEAA